MTVKETSILLVEDDPQIRRFLKVGLTSHCYICWEALSGQEALGKIANLNPDLVILDLGLPDMDGKNFLKILREWSQVQVIVLTARDQEKEKIQVLDYGADDYLTKPFSIGELLARIRVALRHAKRSDEEMLVYQNGCLRLDPVKRQVFVHEKEVHLTPIEYKILLYLAKHPDKVVTQSQILKEIWGANHSQQGSSLRVHMHQLRHKLEEDPARPKWLINEPAVGYRFKME